MNSTSRVGQIYQTKWATYTIIHEFHHPRLDKNYLVIQDQQNLFNVRCIIDDTNSKEVNNGGF
jgi:hypothetical protein